MMNWSIFLLTFFFLSFPCLGQFQFEHHSGIVVEKDQKILSLAWAGGLNAGQYTTIDLNNDGKPDLVVFDRTTDKTNVFLQKDNEYHYSPEYEVFFPRDINSWVIFADYDCDGEKDLFTKTLFGIKVYKNVSSTSYPKWQVVADPLFTRATSGPTNLQVNATDIPAIIDIDSDGDLDIIVFDYSGGELVELHKNVSKEKGNSCGIEFELETRNWGNFRECDCSFSFGEPCPTSTGGRVARPMHAGGKSILAFDAEGDGDKDVLIGHEECENLFFLENAGSKEEAKMLNYSGDYPAGNPASFNIFPAAYFEDVDFDGIKDLVVAPNVNQNITDAIDFRKSSWFYRNVATNDKPSFVLDQKDFLQNEMIDIGEGAAPAFADLDGDNDLDLFIGHVGNIINNDFYASVHYYENIGSINEPKFRFVTDDYLSLSSLKLRNIKPQFVDFNQDNSLDLIFTGTQQIINNTTYFVETKIYYLQNTASLGNGVQYNLSDLKNIHKPIGFNDQPLFVDVDNDRNIDLLLAKATGNLEYHRNTGTDFVLSEKHFNGIKENYRRSNLFATTTDLNNDGDLDLITADKSDTLRIYPSFLNKVSSEIPLKVKNSISENKENPRIGYLAKITFADLFNQKKPSLIIGNNQGGLNFIKNTSETATSLENKLNLKIKVNPVVANKPLLVWTDKDAEVEIILITGQILKKGILTQSEITKEIDVSGFTPGLYILRGKAMEGGGVDVKKVIIGN